MLANRFTLLFSAPFRVWVGKMGHCTPATHNLLMFSQAEGVQNISKPAPRVCEFRANFRFPASPLSDCNARYADGEVDS